MSQPLSTLLAGGTDTPLPDRAHRLLVAQRLAEAVATVHAAGGVIGNLDDQRVLVEPDGTVTVGDDARKVTEASAAAYTAPELQGASTSHTRREAQHDLFALAVLLFQLLMDGRHPYAGQWVGGGDLPDIPKAIQLGLYAYGGSSVTPPPGAPALSTLEPGLADFFKRSFAPTSAIFRTRPTGSEWARALAAAQQDGTSRRPPPVPASPSPRDRSAPVFKEPAVAEAVESASPVALDEASIPALQGPDSVLVQPGLLIEPAKEQAPPSSTPQPIAEATPEAALQKHPEVTPKAPSLSHYEAGQPEARVLAQPAKQSFSRRSRLKRVVPANDSSSVPPVPSRPAQPEPSSLENFVSEIQWLVESDLRWLLNPKVWGSIFVVIFGFLFVLSILAFVRPEDRANPLTRPAGSQATRVPATRTPLPTATRTVVTNPTVASFGSNFDVSDGVIPSTGEAFSAYVRDRALRLEVFTKGARGKVMFSTAPAEGNFNFTVHVGEITGQGEILIYAHESESGRTWVFAIDPGGSTWCLYEERPSNKTLKVTIARTNYSSAIGRQPLRTISVARKGERTRLFINGVAVNPQLARSMPQISEPLTVGVGAMIPDDPDYADEPFIVTVERVAMLADER